MTAAAAIGARAPNRQSLPLAFSIAMRELRSGAGGLVVFVLCIALGVAAVASIGSLAASFDEAVAGIRRTRPDVAIFDIQLSAGSGIDALAEAKREQPGLRAIVLTNYATPQHEKASVDAGAECFLDKSADFEKIAEVLEGMKAEVDRSSD